MSGLKEAALGVASAAVAELERTSGVDSLPDDVRKRAVQAAQDLALAQLQRFAGESVEEAEQVAQASMANISAGLGVMTARALVGALQRALIDGIQRIALPAL